MGKIEIDALDDKVIQGLEVRARLNGRSLEEGIRALLSQHALLSPAERVALADRIRAMTPNNVKQTDSTIMIWALRDAHYNLD